MSKKTFVGKVISNKMQKTLVVLVERTVMHPIYKKFYKIHKKYSVHDENSQGKIGDVVQIVESRPLSKTKRWKLVEIIKHSEDLLAVQEGGQ